MKHLSVLLVIVVAMTLSLGACLSTKKDEALFAPLEGAWPAVRQDLHYGVFSALKTPPLIDEAAVDVLMMRGDSLGDAIARRDVLTLRAVRWDSLEPWALRGVQAQLDAEEIGPGVAQSLREQISNFTTAVSALEGN